jgi:fatty-acyl-CoA synthase
MNGLMMDFPLTLSAVFRHAERVYPRREVVTRRADKSLHRYTLGDFAIRSRRLAGALRTLGVRSGDRVATLAWNHHQHLEAYFGVSMSGGVLHTLNIRLHPDEIAFIVNDADDRVVLVDETLLPLWEKVATKTKVGRVIVVGAGNTPATDCVDYEAMLADAHPRGWDSVSRTPCCRSCRCSTPMRGACRMPR